MILCVNHSVISLEIFTVLASFAPINGTRCNITRFRNDLLKLTVDGQPVVMIQLVLNKSRILINPKVYYKGTRLDEVKNIEDDIRQILNKGKSKE